MCSISINEKPDRESGRVFLLHENAGGQGGGGLGFQLRRGGIGAGLERIKEKQQTKEPRAEQRKKREEESDAGND